MFWKKMIKLAQNKKKMLQYISLVMIYYFPNISWQICIFAGRNMLTGVIIDNYHVIFNTDNLKMIKDYF